MHGVAHRCTEVHGNVNGGVYRRSWMCIQRYMKVCMEVHGVAEVYGGVHRDTWRSMEVCGGVLVAPSNH